MVVVIAVKCLSVVLEIIAVLVSRCGDGGRSSFNIKIYSVGGHSCFSIKM